MKIVRSKASKYCADERSGSNSYDTKAGRDYTVEFHDTPQLWVAYFCGCPECPKGTGKTQDEAVADLRSFCGYEDDSSATKHEGSNP